MSLLLVAHDGFSGSEAEGIGEIQKTSEEEPPEVPEANILQPDRKFEKDSEFAVAGIFTMSSEPPTSSLFVFPQKRGKRGGVGGIQNPGAAGDVPQQQPQPSRKPYSYNDRKRKNADERRDIKKKLFMDLGIIRSSSGIDNGETNREDSMKRKITETIVTTYCEMCEQNFSSSKMLLLHRSKVHNTPFIECHLCLKLFSQTIHFNRHMKTHYGPNAMSHVQCELCERQFKDKESLKTHWDVSHGEKERYKLMQ
ncbi:hypothetical protein GCK72_009125 [Caenorhabditis remanei]|uniref:C2H2-type domain-containing protein n=1 Tax=Caenorhabditis remanei TaxID=31234 RepID=A0A6A5H267_CAERE|nr:hypothetical protein GCK72_009125 [Caenorhabditis remanei]KAF1760874.1 hypothetical protein GCK72_009125 [Caenorhabditis remanei]